MSYPGAVRDPDTGAWISDAEVAEIPYTAFVHPGSGHCPTGRTSVKDARFPDPFFPVWRYQPFFTNTDLPVEAADITHRQHAIIETVFADLIDGPLAHIPSGRFGANSAKILCAAIAHNLLRGAGVLAGEPQYPRTGIDVAPQDRQHSGPPRPPAAPTGPAPAHPLALVKGLACTVAQHHRPQPATSRDALATRQ